MSPLDLRLHPLDNQFLLGCYRALQCTIYVEGFPGQYLVSRHDVWKPSQKYLAWIFKPKITFVYISKYLNFRAKNVQVFWLFEGTLFLVHFLGRKVGRNESADIESWPLNPHFPTSSPMLENQIKSGDNVISPSEWKGTQSEVAWEIKVTFR